MNKQQDGFAHAVLIIGLVVAILGALGFIFWQNFIYKAPETKTVAVKSKDKTASESKDDTAKTDANAMGTYTLELTSGWNNSYTSTPDMEKGYTHSSYTKNSGRGEITVETFTKGRYIEFGSGTPATVVKDLPVNEWYAKQGVEHTASESQAPGSKHGGYAYKLTRYRGQTNNAVMYVLKNDFLYKITIQEGDDAQLLSVNTDGSAKYTLSSDLQKILASVQVSS